jgi:hypothetical protein
VTKSAHVTLRSPAWWKGVLDIISTEFPEVKILLFCSTDMHKLMLFETWSAIDWEKAENFRIDVPKVKTFEDGGQKILETASEKIILPSKANKEILPKSKFVSDAFLNHMRSQRNSE